MGLGSVSRAFSSVEGVESVIVAHILVVNRKLEEGHDCKFHSFHTGKPSSILQAPNKKVWEPLVYRVLTNIPLYKQKLRSYSLAFSTATYILALVVFIF